MAIAGEVNSELSVAELRKTLYLLHLKDTAALVNVIVAGIQGGKIDLDNLYTYGKTTALQGYERRQSMSDQSFSDLYYEKECNLVSLGDYHAHCEDQGSVYSLISQTSIFLWTFGNPKVLNFDRPWEVFFKRTATYLLAAAVEINFLSFPDWIASQVSTALKGYSLSGMLDEAFIVGELQAKSELSEKERLILDQLMNKNLIPFLPSSEASLKNVIAGNKAILEAR